MFEIFAQFHLHPGGYAPEYRDHPTLIGTTMNFKERSPLNKRNEGRQILPIDGVEGMFKSRLAPGGRWDLGEPGDPNRSVMLDTRLTPGERLAPHRFDDWRGVVVMAGELDVGGRRLGPESVLVIRPGAEVPAIQAGPQGAQLLQIARTAAGVERRTLARETA